MTASDPPLRKKSRTAKPMACAGSSGPNRPVYSDRLTTGTASSVGPWGAVPRNAVTEVATAVIVRSPPASSSMRMPGYEVVTECSVALGA